jgi:putative transcriptional regulator
VPPFASDLHRRRIVRGVCCALALVFAWALPAPAAEPKSLTSILLVARAELPDPDFASSIVLVMNNLGPAPVGLIINRPTPVTVAQLFPNLKQLAQVHDRVYFGGPIAIGSVWFLFRSAARPAHAIQACEGTFVSADRGLLMQLLGRDKPMDGLRIFVGHSGWGPGQLEAEIARKDWTLQRAEPGAIFKGNSEHPWPESRTEKRST